jgi:hypothetical protein
VYNSAGKILRDYSFAQGQTSLQFSLPAGGPYWLDFSAPVVHPDAIETELNDEIAPDPFPFVKSFGATVKVDTVEKGSNRELFLPLRVRETAIMVPYGYNEDKYVDTTHFTPFYDMHEKYPEYSVETVLPSIDRGTDEICFDFDPYGRIYAIGGNLLRFNDFLSSDVIYDNLSQSTIGRGLAFNLRNGHLYHAYQLDGYHLLEHDVSGQESEEISPPNNILQLNSAIITIDEEGTLYGIGRNNNDTNNNGKISVYPMGAYFAGEDIDEKLVSSFDIDKLFGFLGRENPDKWGIFDLKAQNGYLYAILYVYFEQEKKYYDYFAAIPLESIKQGNVKGAWYVGGTSVDELDEKDHNVGSNSLEGFFGPKKFVGWGPERIYVYDYNGVDGETYHRIVEVDLLNRKISRAGLIADIKDLNN